MRSYSIGTYVILLLGFLFNPVHGIVVFWDPPTPVPGDTITIYYNLEEGTLPDDTNPVYIHLGVDGWQNTDDYEMSPSSQGAMFWEYRYLIPSGIAVIDFVFTDLMGNWDNNGGVGIDWHINLNYTWTPFSPTPNDSLTIEIRNASQSGSIVWFVESNDTPLVPIPQYRPPGSYCTEDGEAIETPFLGPDGEGVYHVSFGPFSSGSQVVDFLKFQIHWQDGTWESTLYEIPIDHEPGPDDPVILIEFPAEGATVDAATLISVSAENVASVEFWGGTDSLGTVDTEPYQMQWIPSEHNFGDITIVAKGVSTSGLVGFARRHVFVIPTIQTVPAPHHIADGATIENGTIYFALYAPAKEFVALQGSFNRELPNGELMWLSGDSLWWKSKRLSPGDYWYRYNIEGIKTIADPWSTDVTWKQPGSSAESGDYAHAKSQFAVGAMPFQWTDDDFERPAVDNLIIYELHISDFASRDDGSIGTYQDVHDRINEGYFDSLGINAVELMPVNEFEGENSWGYNPSYYLAPETSYGTPDELRALINSFHEHGIAVLMDVVFNHMWGSAPLFQLYQPLDEWDYREHDYANCPYFHNQQSQWGYKLQHWQEVGGRRYRTWKYVTDALKTWAIEYHFDGFRYDAAWGVGWDGYSNNGMSFYTWYMNEIDSTLIQIIEEDNAYRVNTTETDAGWNFSYFHALKANLQETNDSGHAWGNMNDLANELSYADQEFEDPYGPINYTESHDETRIIYESTVYQGMSEQAAFKKSLLGASILLTGTGTPMLYSGQEFGQNGTSRDENGNVIPQPLQWGNLETIPGIQLYQHYRRLVWLRRNVDILHSNHFQVKDAYNQLKSIVYWRGDETTDQQVVVAANFDNEDHFVVIEFPGDGTWYEFTLDDTVEVPYSVLPNYVLPASTARIFVNERSWPTPVHDAPKAAQPNRIVIDTLYPNPVRDRFTIQFSVPESHSGDIRFEIFDLAGHLVRTMKIEADSRGDNVNVIPLSDPHSDRMGNGIYLYRLRSELYETPVKRFVIIR